MTLGQTMRVFKPYPHIYAFYDGRIAGKRAFSAAPNWLDDGAYALGICSYAIVDGPQALLYDAHISPDHARRIRAHLAAEGVTAFRLLISHWHADHVAGNEVFADCEIIASWQTQEAMAANRAALKNGSPPIHPLTMPTRLFDAALDLSVGRLTVQLRHLDVHSYDSVAALVPDYALLLAGDTLEDPITYVDEPQRLAVHLDELSRMGRWEFEKILPSHGAAGIISTGGYGLDLIHATKRYTEKLLRIPQQPELAEQNLQTFAKEAFATGGITYFEPYEQVHRQNIKAILAAALQSK